MTVGSVGIKPAQRFSGVVVVPNRLGVHASFSCFVNNLAMSIVRRPFGHVRSRDDCR
jgi:hypothetical protein